MEDKINKLNITMTKLETNIGHIKESLEDNKEEHKEIREMITDFVEASEKRFAPMWVANVLKTVLYTAGTAIILAVLSQIIK